MCPVCIPRRTFSYRNDFQIDKLRDTSWNWRSTWPVYRFPSVISNVSLAFLGNFEKNGLVFRYEFVWICLNCLSKQGKNQIRKPGRFILRNATPPRRVCSYCIHLHHYLYNIPSNWKAQLRILNVKHEQFGINCNHSISSGIFELWKVMAWL